MALLLISGAADAGTGVDHYVAIPQVDENEEELPDIVKHLLSYYFTFEETCLDETPWCVKDSEGTHMMHEHLVDDDLTPAEKVMADRGVEAEEEAFTAENRLASATFSYNCLAYALGRTDVWVSGAMGLWGADYHSGPPWHPDIEVGTIADHAGAHTSLVSAYSTEQIPPYGERTQIERVKQKCGAGGVYVTDPGEVYPNISSVWFPN